MLAARGYPTLLVAAALAVTTSMVACARQSAGPGSAAAPAAQGTVSPGAQPTAELQYLQHSGWIVRTPTHVLVFDYVERLPSGIALPDSLKLTADSFDKRRVMVFVSHGHEDHFDKVVQDWKRARPDIQYVVGAPGVELPGAKVMKPRESWSADGVEVKTTASTDEGVGFLVTVDGLTLYHAGDHARWVDAVDADFMAEIDWLKRAAPRIDIALFPIATGSACEPRAAIADGVRAAARVLAPRVLIPMHVGCPDRLALYAQFGAASATAAPTTQVVAPAARGARFRYAGGSMSARR